MEFNRDWREARDELLSLPQTRISYETFGAVCAMHGLENIAASTLARLMHDLGYIVYYGSDEHLKNDVVLQPEWLTKAIGFVLENRTTQEMEGLLPDSRLVAVWHDHCFEGARYDPTLYPFFLRLMEKYDVSYRLEQGDASLVAQQVPQVRPPLPWLPKEKPAPGLRRLALVCIMDETPSGLVPWMIVRTHAYSYVTYNDGKAHRHHWQKGMFLRNKAHGQAMLELRDREFHIYATRQDIVDLLYGFEERDSIEQMGQIPSMLKEGFRGLESLLASSVLSIMQAIASESKDGPRLFTIAPSATGATSLLSVTAYNYGVRRKVASTQS
jgi:hypothetical protein